MGCENVSEARKSGSKANQTAASCSSSSCIFGHHAVDQRLEICLMSAKAALKPADCRVPIIQVAATLLLFNVTIAQAQTIDCSVATAADEVAICGSADLRTMDGELDRAYRAARVRWTSSMSNSVRVMQEEWLK